MKITLPFYFYFTHFIWKILLYILKLNLESVIFMYISFQSKPFLSGCVFFTFISNFILHMLLNKNFSPNIVYDKQDHQGKAALNERSPNPTQQQEPVARSRGGPSGSDSMTMAIPDVFFVCNSTSRRIPWVNKCDKTFHCEDKTDEVNCTLEGRNYAII
jgi:hypothetical protein